MIVAKRVKDGQPAHNNEELLTINELANILKVPKGWIYQRTRERSPSGLPFFKIGKYLRFSLSDVQAWLHEQRRGWQEGQ